MVRDVKLLTHLPPYLAEYRQFQTLFHAEDAEVMTLNTTIEQLRNNQYITTCNEVGIARYEQLLGIAPNTGDTLQVRRLRVLSRWVENLPYTYRVLIERLNAMCGEGNYTVDADLNRYRIEIRIYLSLHGLADDISELIKQMAPANMDIFAIICLEYSYEFENTFGTRFEHFGVTTGVQNAQHYAESGLSYIAHATNKNRFAGRIVIDRKYTLDGTWRLDGSKKLNAAYIDEPI